MPRTQSTPHPTPPSPSTAMLRSVMLVAVCGDVCGGVRKCACPRAGPVGPGLSLGPQPHAKARPQAEKANIDHWMKYNEKLRTNSLSHRFREQPSGGVFSYFSLVPVQGQMCSTTTRSTPDSPLPPVPFGCPPPLSGAPGAHAHGLRPSGGGPCVGAEVSV